MGHLPPRQLPPRHRATSWRRALVVPATAAAAALVVVPLSMPATASSGPEVTATVLLTGAGDVSPLATASALPRAARLTRLRASMPDAAVRATVAAEAAGLGLTVLDATPWSVVVRGGATGVARLAGAAGVAHVVRAGGQRPSPAAVAQPLRGSDWRTAYQTKAPKTASSGPAPVVATIQFAGWQAGELAAYATQRGLAKPAAAQYQAISVGGASTTVGSEPGSGEVALDQESIYETDPYASQRAYFADPSLAGLVAALDRVAVDAQAFPGLAALSISWTWCTNYLSSDDTSAVHAALGNVLAAGVTVFAASGDDGAYCGLDGGKDVAYPAADPYVVAVGGTRLTMGPTVETGWGVRDGTRTSGWFASGGGTAPWPAESWQDSPTNRREVPDIAADADLDTGFYAWHDRGDGTGAGYQQYGGTSLAAALTTAAYTAELASRGALDGGLGDLHTSLYSAPAADFRDVTSGTNGLYSAKAGYDLVTGLGAPQWGRLVDRLLTQPVLSVPPKVTSRVVPVSVSAPAGQTFLGWATGYGTPPTSCGSSAGKPADPADVIVPADGTYRIWAQGYVGNRRCFTVTTSTVVDTGQPAPVTTAPVTTAPVSSAPVTTAPVTAAPTTTAPTSSAVTTTPAAAAPGPPAVVVADVTPATLQVRARRTSPAGQAIAFSWSASDPSGVASVTATVYRDGTPVSRRAVAASSSLAVKGDPGHAYRLGVVAVDGAGNIDGAASSSVRLPYDDRVFSVGKGWSRARSGKALGGSVLTSSRAGAGASVRLVGAAFTLLATTGPKEGLLAVYVDGRHVRDVSLYSKATHLDVGIVLTRFHKAGAHRITVVVKGKRAPHSKGTAVVVDGLQVL